ncbi:ABC transporter ATP-binding protein [Gulosibacter sediminis]|uniref:ABC transporter ATP-binding protein n=1 Tax=Gulosibacter sediminis TaxID=1729695 RepID=UPI0024A92E00|nr:ABC transporter ATP-binding protein [Gulosibacter sediminis]
MTEPHPLILEARELNAGYGATTIVHGANVVVPPGKITVILGANACGKSTLLKTFVRVLKPLTGSVVLDGRDITQLPSKRLARQLGLLPQQPIAPEGITVYDLVARGRHPHHRLFQTRAPEDDAIIADALAATGVTELAERAVDELSGGQRQRVWIAMALAQRTEVLLLDEPTTFLDVAHQYDVLDLLTDLNRERGTTIVMVLHDVNIAARYADHLIAMQQGRIVAAGAPGEVVTEATMSEVYGMTSRVIPDPVSGAPLVLPVGRHHIHTTGGIHAR